MMDIVISGMGGAGREVKSMIDRINAVNPTYNFLGNVVNDNNGDNIFCNDDELLKYDKDIAVVIAVGNMSLRKKLAELYSKNPHIKFPNIIDPAAIIMNEIDIGKGNIICAGTIITVNVRIGNFCYINMGCTIAHEDIIDDYVSINPGCNISGAVHIKSLTEIGTGTAIVQGLTIGSEVDVWAGSSVIKNIKDKSVVYGIPAHVLCHKDS